ncbi:hypothetical protein G6F43_006134 [Rhizopus delemar]|nr:hypothetical protein G6F43_006134 [Rhizopus delemar]
MSSKESDEQAVDETIFQELCTAAKEGDIEKVESLVNHFNAPINIVDKWQCSPLYWACLCGHYAVVKFLLENGAQCDRNTFQGERCLYGALNSDIRNLLLSYKLTKAIDENQPYLLFLSNLLENHNHHDLTFSTLLGDKQHEFHVHKFILAARSSFFAKNLLNRWRGQSCVKFQKNMIHPISLLSILRYIYTGYVDHDLDKDIVENMIFATKHLELTHLHQLLLNQEDDNALRSHTKQEITILRNDFEQFYNDLIKISIIAQPNDDHTSWRMLSQWLTDKSEMKQPDALFADIALRLHNNIIFPCHKAYLCRSEFFNTMLNGPFGEQEAGCVTIRYPDQDLELSLIEVFDVEADIFGHYVLQFLYTDKCTIPPEDAYDVLIVADMLLIDRLKAIAAIAITNQEEPVVDIYELIQTAIELEVERVEQYCIKYFADHLDEYIKQPEFLNLIKMSAQSIKRREETDSIPFIDDLRYFLSKKYFIADEDLNESGRVNEEYQDTWTEMESLYNQKLEILDQILESLGLEA